MYSIIANASYIWLGLKGRLKLSGGSIAHVGFGMVLLGIVISASNKEVLTNNRNGIPAPLGDGENPMENLTLVQGLTVDMGKYNLTYEGDSTHPKKPLSFYKIRFKSKDGKEEFVLQPNSFVNYKGNEGLMSNPASRHYWDHDVFTYITSISNPDAAKDTTSFKTNKLKQGDTLFYSSGFMILQEVKKKTAFRKSCLAKKEAFTKHLLRYIQRQVLFILLLQDWPTQKEKLWPCPTLSLLKAWYFNYRMCIRTTL